MHQGLLCNLAGIGGRAHGLLGTCGRGVLYTQPMPREMKQPRLDCIKVPRTQLTPAS